MFGKFKGVERILNRGKKGPSDRALSKTVRKLAARKYVRAGKKAPNFGPEYNRMVRWRLNRVFYRIAVSSALKAIGLDTRNPQSKMARKTVQTLMQRSAVLVYEFGKEYGKKKEMTPSLKKKEKELNDLGACVAAAIVGAKGEAEGRKAVNDFFDTFEIHLERARKKYRELFSGEIGTHSNN